MTKKSNRSGLPGKSQPTRKFEIKQVGKISPFESDEFVVVIDLYSHWFPHIFGGEIYNQITESYILLLEITSFKVKVKSLSRLCDPKDCSLPGFSVHRILQARVLEWVAISFSRGSSWCRNQTQVSHIACRCFTLWATRVKSIFNYSILFLITTFISPGIRRTCSLHIWDK